MIDKAHSLIGKAFDRLSIDREDYYQISSISMLWGPPPLKLVPRGDPPPLKLVPQAPTLKLVPPR